MAVFTDLSAEEVARVLKNFALGDFLRLEPIASGIENTNYFLETTKGRWVLTVFERLKPEQLPYYLELCEHLKKKGCRVASPVRSLAGNLFEFIKEKPFSIADRLTGENVADVNDLECGSMGGLLAQMHLAARDFALEQPNLRGLSWWQETAPKVRPYLSDAQRSMMDSELAYQEKLQTSDEWLSLTSTACHCDLFRNNTLIAGHGTPEAHVAGVFDFYFAGTTPWLYDLAVTVNDWCIDPETGLLDAERVRALMDAYNRVRPLSQTEKGLWRGALRAAAMRFWMSRLFDFYLPRKASLLKPLDPTHFERVLRDRMTCSLYWPQ